LKKILVFENVREMEPALSAYIRQHWKKYEIKVLYNVDECKQKDVVEHLAWCDILAVQSIFGNSSQIEMFIDLMRSLKTVPEVHLIHTTGKFLEFINKDVIGEYRDKFKELLDSGLKVYNVYYEMTEDPNIEGQYFKKFDYWFAAVKLYNAKKFGLIWNEHEHVVSTVPKKIFKKQTYFFETDPKPSWADGLTTVEMAELKNMLSEMYVRTNDLLEDVESTQKHVFAPSEKKSMIKTNKLRQTILDKLGITPFR
jgi:hypothetical protein